MLKNIDIDTEIAFLSHLEAEIQLLPVFEAAILDFASGTSHSIEINTIELLILENIEKDSKFASLLRLDAEIQLLPVSDGRHLGFSTSGYVAQC